MAHISSAGASLADVAKLAGVSAQTVSRVANDSPSVRSDTRERVLAAMEQLGYRPSFAARSLRRGSYRSVGVAVSGNISDTGRRLQVEGTARVASARAFAMTLVLLDVEATFAEASRRIESLPVDGQILHLSSVPADFDCFEPPAALPTVIISTRPHSLCATVSNDQVACSRTIVEHLIGKGHREIRFVGGKPNSPTNLSRIQGWEETLAAHGLAVAEPLLGDWSADCGYELGARLAADESCTAVYASNDAVALGVIQALRDAGKRVPEDVSVVGVDDSLAGIVPKLELSSYRFDNERVGSVAFDLAVGPSADGQPPHVLVPGTLIERASVRSL